MTKNIDNLFFLVGLLLLSGGMVLGEVMGMSGNHALMPVHVHVNLAGGVFCCLFGIAYRLWPALSAGILPTVHFVLSVVGVLVMGAGLTMIYGGGGETPPAIALTGVGSTAVLIGTLVFLYLFATRAFKAA
jgi:hypothetical protein